MAAPKTLLIDVETSPNIAYVWGRYEQDVLGDFIAERQIICFSWQWMHESNINVLALPDFPTYRKNPENNRLLIRELHKLISQADIIVGHNIEQFDSPMANTDFIVNDLPPTPPHRTVDTLKFARSKFRFNSNKLGDLGKRLGLGEKVKHWGFDLWVGCMRGDPKAWALMKKYNVGDVRLLKAVYLKQKPWMTNHPNLCAPDKLPGCPSCRSLKVERKGWIINRWGKKQRYHCLECGKWMSGALINREWKFT